jgi:hypothetical protein
MSRILLSNQRSTGLPCHTLLEQHASMIVFSQFQARFACARGHAKMRIKDTVCQLIRNANDGNNCIAKLENQRDKLSSLKPPLREVQASCATAPSVPLAAPVPTAEHSDMHVHRTLHVRCTQVMFEGQYAVVLHLRLS